MPNAPDSGPRDQQLRAAAAPYQDSLDQVRAGCGSQPHRQIDEAAQRPAVGAEDVTAGQSAEREHVASMPGRRALPTIGRHGSPGQFCVCNVYDGCMSRTNIDIDDELVAQVMRRYGVSTKKQAVDLALRRLVGVPLSREFLLSLEGIGWDADLDDIRRERPSDL
mgnify:CR=1 FL=1